MPNNSFVIRVLGSELKKAVSGVGECSELLEQRSTVCDS